MFSLSAALIIPNLSISLLAHPPDKTADTDELSYTVLRVIQQKKWGNWPSAAEEVSHKPTGFSEALSLPGMHWLCHSSSCSSWCAPLLYGLPGDQANQNTAHRGWPVKGTSIKGTCWPEQPISPVTVCLARKALVFLPPLHIFCKCWETSPDLDLAPYSCSWPFSK